MIRNILLQVGNRRAGCQFNLQHRRFSGSDSFMQTVINQVKRDLEKDPSLRQAMQEFEQETHLSNKITKFNHLLERWKGLCRTGISRVSETKNRSSTLQYCRETAKSAACFLNKVTTMLHDQDRVSRELREKWRHKVDRMRSGEEGQVETFSSENALVVASESSWERFGGWLKDMPLLSRFFGNPLLSHLFGSSTLAAAIGHMKKADGSFNLPDLLESIEHVVAPHIVESYLKGDANALKAHCGECAFNVLNASIRERVLQKVSLDPSILILKDVELKGGMIMDNSDPWFIFNFTTQQLNCMRNNKGQVFAGSEDDIRELVYSMAVSRHPNLFQENLEYPYMVHEIAIVSNRPCW